MEDYKYCIETTAKKALTTKRVAQLLEDYVAKRAKPDVMDSEREPINDEGPVYKVVGSTLMALAMNSTKDVVLHIYSGSDDKWEDDSYAFVTVYPHSTLTF